MARDFEVQSATAEVSRSCATSRNAGDLLRRVREHIAARQAFEESAQILRDAASERRSGKYALDELRSVSRLAWNALFVEAAAQIVGRGDIELPERFGFPGRQRFGIDGADIGIGKQAEQLQAFGRADFFGESADGCVDRKYRGAVRLADMPDDRGSESGRCRLPRE